MHGFLDFSAIRVVDGLRLWRDILKLSSGHFYNKIAGTRSQYIYIYIYIYIYVSGVSPPLICRWGRAFCSEGKERFVRTSM